MRWRLCKITRGETKLFGAPQAHRRGRKKARALFADRPGTVGDSLLEADKKGGVGGKRPVGKRQAPHVLGKLQECLTYRGNE